MRHPPAPAVVTCPVCGRRVRVNLDGTLRAHYPAPAAPPETRRPACCRLRGTTREARYVSLKDFFTWSRPAANPGPALPRTGSKRVRAGTRQTWVEGGYKDDEGLSGEQRKKIRAATHRGKLLYWD